MKADIKGIRWNTGGNSVRLPSTVVIDFKKIGFTLILLGFTGFYRVLIRFIGFLLGFTGLYWVLLGFTGFY